MVRSLSQKSRVDELWNIFHDLDDFLGFSAACADFLGFSITKIHHNAFWPEAADKAPQYDYLKDQWGSVRDPLTPELYEYGRNVLFPVYKAWKDEFGVLPDTWGEFI